MPKESTKTQAQRRRNRVNHIKNTIVITIALWMLISMVAIIVLIVQVARTNTKLNKLAGKTTATTTLQDKDTPTSDVPETEDPYADLVTGVDDEENAFAEGDTHQVYLTFDCVPSENTDAILDVLKANNIKATFFVSGDDSEEAAAIYKRIVDEGHTIGMRSYCDSYSELYSSTDAFTSDLDKIHTLIEDTTGVDCKYYRFPGGTFNNVSDVNCAEFVHILNEQGITYFDWNVDAGDAARDYSSSDIVTNVTEGVTNYKTSVVILRDTEEKETTAESLDKLIESLQAMDAEILPIDESTYQIQYIKSYSVE